MKNPIQIRPNINLRMAIKMNVPACVMLSVGVVSVCGAAAYVLTHEKTAKNFDSLPQRAPKASNTVRQLGEGSAA